MHERHEYEQFFFDEATLDTLALIASRYDYPCCLCTPSLGAELEKRGVRARTLDLDDRFSYLRGFLRYDISSPQPLREEYGIIICDPPFLTVSLPRLFYAIEVLSLGDYRQPLLVNNLASRTRAVTTTFAPFSLQPTGLRPTYARIQNVGRNQMEFYGNLMALR